MKKWGSKMKKLKVILCGLTLGLIISLAAYDTVVIFKKNDPGDLGSNTPTERKITTFKKDPGDLG